LTRSNTDLPKWLVRKKLLKSWGITERDENAPSTYQTKIERVMRFKEDPNAGRRGEFEEQVKRGWPFHLSG